MPAPLQAAAALLRREWVGLLRQPADWLTPLAFVVSVVALFPLGLGPARLRELAPGLLWIVALLASLLSLPRLFAADLADGSLDQWWLSPLPRPLAVALKLAVHWGWTGLPLVLLAPLLALAFGVADAGPLALSLLLGTPALTLLGGLGAALVLHARAGAGLLALLLLPLQVPVLVFGSTAAQGGSQAGTALLLLGAWLAVLLALAPWGTAATLSLMLD
ncbi:MAG: heme exporter protein CcmB [Methylibium sp.]|jgi:heme exporter protein B|nr:heme exporter protein CcmB [Methylibium sp.]